LQAIKAVILQYITDCYLCVITIGRIAYTRTRSASSHDNTKQHDHKDSDSSFDNFFHNYPPYRNLRLIPLGLFNAANGGESPRQSPPTPLPLAESARVGHTLQGSG